MSLIISCKSLNYKANYGIIIAGTAGVTSTSQPHNHTALKGPEGMTDHYTITPVSTDPRRKDTRAAAMYQRYLDGLSLAQVGIEYGVTRSSVFGLFKSRGYQLRARTFSADIVIFDGEKFTPTKAGYYRSTRGSNNRGRLLHRVIWEHFNGPIPADWDVHHKDEDKRHNDISNFECLPKPEHTRLYSPHNNQFTRGSQRRQKVLKSCSVCTGPMPPHQGESPSAYIKRQCCSRACGHVSLRGRRRA